MLLRKSEFHLFINVLPELTEIFSYFNVMFHGDNI